MHEVAFSRQRATVDAATYDVLAADLGQKWGPGPPHRDDRQPNMAVVRGDGESEVGREICGRQSFEGKELTEKFRNA